MAKYTIAGHDLQWHAGSGISSDDLGVYIVPLSGVFVTASGVGVDVAYLGGIFEASGAAAAVQHDDTGPDPNEHVDHTAVTLTAGAGLTGGGDISASRTFDVVVGSGLYVLPDEVGFDTAFGDARYALSGTIPGLGSLAGSGLISDGSNIHVQVGSGLYLQDDLVGFDTAFGDVRYSLSGDYLEKAEGDARWAASGYAYDAGSGLISTGENYHVQTGSGLYLTDDLVGFDTAFGDARYALSGATLDAFAGSGLIAVGDILHAQVGSGLYLQDDLFGVDFTQVAPSGDYVTQAEADVLYAASGFAYAAGSGLISTGENYHVQVGSGMYLLDDEIGVDFSSLSGTFLRLDASNGPLTGQLDISGNAVTATSGVFGDAADPANGIIAHQSGVTFRGSAKPWSELWVNPTVIRVGGDRVPAFGDFIGGLKTYIFEDRNRPQQMYFEIQLPQGIDHTTPVIPHLHYAPATTSADDVQFFFEYAFADPGEVYSATTTVSGLQAAGTANEHEVMTFPEIDISSAGENAMLICRLYRDGNEPGDDYDDDIAYLQFNIHHKLKSLGSAESFVD